MPFGNQFGSLETPNKRSLEGPKISKNLHAPCRDTQTLPNNLLVKGRASTFGVWATCIAQSPCFPRYSDEWSCTAPSSTTFKLILLSTTSLGPNLVRKRLFELPICYGNFNAASELSSLIQTGSEDFDLGPYVKKFDLFGFFWSRSYFGRDHHI